MGYLTLVVCGARSGKSRFAEQLAGASPPVTYLATAVAADAQADPEMAERIERHRQRRAERVPSWQTVEEGHAVAAAVRAHGSVGCVLVECLTLWLTNLILGSPDRPAETDTEVLRAVGELARAGREVPARVIVVSNEVGCGIIPLNALARRFADLLGEANQILAAEAEEVHTCVAGIPLRLKAPGH
jgi:adenosylcobinamide kinase/adenosylcobinamide-phosphate guanylyltransferase